MNTAEIYPSVSVLQPRPVLNVGLLTPTVELFDTVSTFKILSFLKDLGLCYSVQVLVFIHIFAI